MALATIKLVATQLEVVKEVFKVLQDLTNDDRVPTKVREELMDKVNSIMESNDEDIKTLANKSPSIPKLVCGGIVTMPPNSCINSKVGTDIDINNLIPKKILTVNEVRKHHKLPPIPNGNDIYQC